MSNLSICLYNLQRDNKTFDECHSPVLKRELAALCWPLHLQWSPDPYLVTTDTIRRSSSDCFSSTLTGFLNLSQYVDTGYNGANQKVFLCEDEIAT